MDRPRYGWKRLISAYYRAQPNQYWLDRWREEAADNDRLRAALKRIIDEAESDDGLTAWDRSEIAKAALYGP